MGRFDEKVALLTGAASGIGRECALLFAAEGASVYGADIDEKGLAETAGQVIQAGGKISTGRFDLTRRDDCRGAVEAAVAAPPMNAKLDFPEAMNWKLARRYVGHRGMAEPSEIARAIAYLASDDARFMHGTILSIDGGISAT